MSRPKKKREYKPEDWNLYPWPEPKPGYKYGPTPMQEQVFIYHYKPWERPHFHNLDLLLLVGGAGSGKSFRKGTQVLCFDGTTKKIEDIQVGDLLMGPDSTPRKVLDLGRGKEQFYRVVPIKGEAFECNKSHILSLKMTNQGIKTIKRADGSLHTKPARYQGQEIVNVQVSEYLTWSSRKKKAYKLYRAGVIDFHKRQTLPLDPYTFGLWLGDGNSRDFCFTSINSEIISHLIMNEGCKDSVDGRKPHIHRPRNYKKNKILKSLNVIQNKHIPNMYKTSAIKNRLKLLAGLLDTDGYLGRNTFEITQKRKQLAEDIVFLCRSLGLAAYMREVRKSCPTKEGGKFTGTYWKISISGDLSIIPTKVPYKKATTRKQKKSHLVTGFSLEPLEEDDYYGVVLDKDHLFLLADFTVVHNSATLIAAISELVASFPGCAAIVGGANMPLLKRNVMDEFGKVFSWKSPDGINYPWEHPMVLKPPPEKTPVAPFWNGASIRFLNINDPEIVRGFTADVFGIEEVNLMEADSLKEMLRRSRGKSLPIRQFILNMNPTGTRDWVYDMFQLKQFESAYEGDPIPIGEPCTCQYCHVCMGQEKGEFEWEGGEKKIGPNGRFYSWEGGKCPNPECPTFINTGRVQQKETNCPGNQHYYRVVRSASLDNPHLPADFVQLQKGALSAEEYATYVKGEIVELRQGYIYTEYSDVHNVMDLEFDETKDIYWTHDFNINPMCSFICQEEEEGLSVVDEITLWAADELDVAEEFVERYKDFRKTVWLYGDPNGLNASRKDSKLSSYKIIYDHLRSKGFDVRMGDGMRKIPGQRHLINILQRVNTLKGVLCDSDGNRRVFIDTRCLNLRESLKHVQWDDRSKTPKEDDRCDDNSKQNPKRHIPPVLMTHPQAALGYLVAKKYPMFKDKTGIRILESEVKSVVADNHSIEIKEKTPPPAPEVYTVEYDSPPLKGIFSEGIGREILNERLEYEKKMAEEAEKKLRDKLRKLDEQ